MDLKLDIKPQDNHLYVKVSGTYEIEKAKELFKGIIDSADKFSLYNILVDYRGIKGSLSTMDNYEYAKHVANLLQNRIFQKKFPILRLAYLGSRPFLDISGFGETVAINRGATVLDTDNMQEAIDWLQE